MNGVELFRIEVASPYTRLVCDDNHAVPFVVDRTHGLGGTVNEFKL
jgi:hypothetical protein